MLTPDPVKCGEHPHINKQGLINMGLTLTALARSHWEASVNLALLHTSKGRSVAIGLGDSLWTGASQLVVNTRIGGCAKHQAQAATNQGETRQSPCGVHQETYRRGSTRSLNMVTVNEYVLPFMH